MSEPRASSSRRRPLVWIADDSPTETLYTEHVLGPSYEFERFEDGSAVVEQLGVTSRQPDLLVLDWVMPSMSGDEVCKFVRANPRTNELPIILVTASRIETNDIVEGLASGANDYVARPFAPEELRARVDAALRAKDLRDRTARQHARLATVGDLGRALVEAGPDHDRILVAFAEVLTRELCDGVAIRTVPGVLPGGVVCRARGQDVCPELVALGNLADPIVASFESDEEALVLPAAYRPYVQRHGLRGLAILPFPTRSTVQAAVTVVRHRGSEPFVADDLETLETCIEYAAMAVESATRFSVERTARSQLHDILAHLPLGILVANPDGEITFRNSIALQMSLGGDRGRTIADALRAMTVDEASGRSGSLDDAHARVNAGQALLDVPVRVGAQSMEVSMVPVRGHGGRVDAVVLALHDVTEVRAIDAERQRIGQFQEQLLAIAGHDIRTPLTAIMMAGEAIRQHGAQPEVTRLADRVIRSSKRIARMVEQLLDVTRARLGGGIPMAFADTNLTVLVRNVVDELSLSTDPRRFEVLAPATAVIGTWDPDRLAQVVANLVGNAVGHGRAGTAVTIELRSTDDRATLVVRNQNQGEPLTRDVLASLFDPFRRGVAASHRGDGLGLGLYIVHEIVRAHGGTIVAESTPTGTAFRVDLPRWPRSPAP